MEREPVQRAITRVLTKLSAPSGVDGKYSCAVIRVNDYLLSELTDAVMALAQPKPRTLRRQTKRVIRRKSGTRIKPRAASSVR